MRNRVTSGRVGCTILSLPLLFFFFLTMVEGRPHVLYVASNIGQYLIPLGSISAPRQYISYSALAAYNMKYIALVAPLIHPCNMIQ